MVTIWQLYSHKSLHNLNGRRRLPAKIGDSYTAFAIFAQLRVFLTSNYSNNAAELFLGIFCPFLDIIRPYSHFGLPMENAPPR